MADTTNRKIVPLPSLLEMEPKLARRAWAIFMADQDWGFGSTLLMQAEHVSLSVEQLVLNRGREAEGWARQNFERQFAAFCDLWAQRSCED